MAETFVGSKGVDSNIDFGFDWLRLGWLSDSETIVDSLWTSEDVTVNITRLQIDSTLTITSCFLAGGTLGTTVKLTNTITTSDGRVDARSWYVKIIER